MGDLADFQDLRLPENKLMSCNYSQRFMTSGVPDNFWYDEGIHIL